MKTLAYVATLGFALVFLSTGNPTALICAIIAAVGGMGLEKQ
jgi:hypothetical protein